MNTYLYEATNFSAETIRGEMQAASHDAVLDYLRRRGYVPLVVDKKAGEWWQILNFSGLSLARPLSKADIGFITQELAMMLRAGLSLERSLDVLKTSADKPSIRKFLMEVLAQIHCGKSFYDALVPQNVVLPKGYARMIQAGEAGGARVLETTLERLAEHLKREQKVNDTLFSAMIYPTIVLGMAVLSIVLILLFVLPQFEPMFESAHNSLPILTRIVMAAGYDLQHYGAFILVMIAVGALALRKMLRNENLRLKQDSLLLSMPKIGSIIIKSEVAKFCHTLGILLSNGVTPITALTIACEGFVNKALVSASKQTILHIKEGKALSKALSRQKLFPALLLQMISIGEETGQLDLMLMRTAEIYDRNVQRSIERAMALFTPLMTILLGLIIATIIAAILSAILSVNDMVT